MMKTAHYLLLTMMTFSMMCKAEMFCPETVYDEYYKPANPTVDVNEIIKKNEPILGGTLKCHVSPNYKTFGENQRYRTEEGTYKGIKYRFFFTDGSGSVQGKATNTLEYVKDKYDTNWSTSCKKDEMDDTRWCALNQGDLRIGIWKDGSYFVTVGHSHYPQSTIAVRVDKNTPITASENSGFSKAQSLQIIEQLHSGSTVLTRYQEWPYQRNKDNSFELFGFKEAWEILGKLYEAAN